MTTEAHQLLLHPRRPILCAGLSALSDNITIRDENSRLIAQVPPFGPFGSNAAELRMAHALVAAYDAYPNLVAALKYCRNRSLGLQAELVEPGGRTPITIAELGDIERAATTALDRLTPPPTTANHRQEMKTPETTL